MSFLFGPGTGVRPTPPGKRPCPRSSCKPGARCGTCHDGWLPAS